MPMKDDAVAVMDVFWNECNGGANMHYIFVVQFEHVVASTETKYPCIVHLGVHVPEECRYRVTIHDERLDCASQEIESLPWIPNWERTLGTVLEFPDQTDRRGIGKEIEPRP
jgi:hypothetical protein